MTPFQPSSMRRAARGQAAFTIVEVSAAIAIFAYFSVGSVLGLLQFNRIASVARYRTLAQAMAQQKMDEVMTTTWSVSGDVPTVLTSGATTETNLPLNSDQFNSQTALSSIYTSSDTQVNAQRVTTVTAITGKTRQLLATVTVTYTYRGRDYTLSLRSLRATDDF